MNSFTCISAIANLRLAKKRKGARKTHPFACPALGPAGRSGCSKQAVALELLAQGSPVEAQHLCRAGLVVTGVLHHDFQHWRFNF